MFSNDLPTMQLWKAGQEREFHNLAMLDYQVANEDHEASVLVPRNKIKDDKFTKFATKFRQLGLNAALWPDRMIWSKVLTGESALCFDGQPMFDTDHPVNYYDATKGTFANLFTSRSLTHANYAYVRSKMMEFPLTNGEPMEVNPNLLIVPPALEEIAREILGENSNLRTEVFGSNTAAASKTNVWMGSAKYLVVPRLAAAYTGGSDTSWYLADTSQFSKPMIYQLREPPVLVMPAMDPKSNDDLFMRRQYKFGVDGRGAAAFGLPHYLAKANQL